ncbi:MAG: 50S ribosomal protein L11 methyltransferase [Odoribacter sp.]|nr:50S ribosomal protein L11 methyltransferase [Odoribacter sp.]MDY3034010.1 50S ribosomal protein L11 methyltransferase [Odoribacter sp.]
MTYTEIKFTIEPYEEPVADALIAELSNIGYDGFSYTDDGFTAYTDKASYNTEAIQNLEILQYFSEIYSIKTTVQEIEDQDWNKVWEENFTPIVVDNRIQVRAGFHEPIPGIEYEIIIEPKMSFGTGHHATTALMLRTILEQASNIKGKRVLDMGCGTGILSIMASKVGAREVTGIDIDEWAYNNAMENLQNNHINNITIKIGDASLLTAEKPFDIILANINRNILLNDMEHYNARLQPEGLLIMSGFYEHDLPMIREKAEYLGLEYKSYHEEKQWVAACFYKK